MKEAIPVGPLRTVTPIVERAKLVRKRASDSAGKKRIKKWRDDEAAFLASMRGRDHEKRGAAEIVGERRR